VQPIHSKLVALAAALLFLAPAGSILAVPPGAKAAAVEGVSLSRTSFNPSQGEAVEISYRLTAADRVWVRIYDPDEGLVRVLVNGEKRPAGPHREKWDGKDLEGRIVPDEAYLFTIETAAGGLYDPTTASGGVVGDLTEARFDRTAGTVSYQLPAASRVLIRLGLHNGPMLKTLVDWKPRPEGSVTEYWAGRDEDDLFELRGRPGFNTLITYVTLPDATVIAFGNKASEYRDYKLGPAKNRPAKPERKLKPELQARQRPEGLVPPAWARAPRVSMTFPQAGDAKVPSVKKEVAVRVDVDPADRDSLFRDQFEVIFFVDNVFFAEAERGHLPFNWRWELQQFPPGEHVLTVNISSFKGQVGVASRKVQVVAE
jgi:flagellar hook capping protein FlgD